MSGPTDGYHSKRATEREHCVPNRFKDISDRSEKLAGRPIIFIREATRTFYFN